MDTSFSVCHYCSRGAEEVPMTKDHIVPRYRVRALRLIGGHPFFGMNLVKACEDCNQLKGYFARMCDCRKCVRAWDVFCILRDIRTSQMISNLATRKGVAA